ncbi:hypothetical protein [Thiohalorhabdus methylotrophus]|uniref:Cytochrome c n=1 Tax=Thiohalorhabdus methylotrophus TaxID=3242694 RepID=A0ABV4TX01_9GAMM
MVRQGCPIATRFMVLGLLLGVMAGPPAAAEEPRAVVKDLSPKLDRLLRREMQAILGAMQTIFGAIVTGDHGLVAEKARAIHASFILKQSLTPSDRQDLVAAVPDRFLKLDKRFHSAAAELARAAEARDTGRQLRVLGRMSRACVTCHGDYVAGRFPGLQMSR